MPSRSRNVLKIEKRAASRPVKREQSSSVRDRPTRLRTRRRNQRLLYAGLAIVFCGVSLGALGGLSHIPALAIRDVEVMGADHVSVDMLKSAVGGMLTSTHFSLFSRANMFLYPKESIEEKLRTDFPRIETVSVSRKSLTAAALSVTLQERKPYATWCNAKQCYVLDEAGFIFAEKDEVAERSYIFQGGLLPNEEIIGQTYLRGRLPSVIKLLDALTAAGFPPQVFTVDSEKDYTITLPSGLRLLGSFDVSPETVISNLSTVIASESLEGKRDALQYIDLRFGNRVYYQ